MKALFALLALLVLPNLGFAHDACQSLVPSALKVQLLTQFTGYRLPRESDNLPDDIEYAREHTGNACLGVDSADFDGDGKFDFLIALTSTDGKGALVLVALTRDDTWKIYKLDSWKDGRSRLYVSSEPAGTYDDVGETDGPLENGAEEHLSCPHSVAVFGQTESSGVAYCFLNSKWKHVWISD